jgi:hypothetical protein
MIMAAGIFVVLVIFSFFYPPGLYLALGYLVIILFLYGGAIFYTTHKRVNRHYFMPKEYHFNNQGVFVKTPVGDQQLKWEQFTRWKKLSDFFVMYLSAHSFIAIPQSDIPPDQLQDFVSILVKHIRKKAG